MLRSQTLDKIYFFIIQLGSTPSHDYNSKITIYVKYELILVDKYISSVGVKTIDIWAGMQYKQLFQIKGYYPYSPNCNMFILTDLNCLLTPQLC